MRMLVLFLCAGVSTLTQGTVTQSLPIEIANLEQYRVTVHTLFFVERTITIPPGSFDVAVNAEYIVLETDSRHTSTNAVKTESNMGEYKYFFAVDQEIIIFDRRPNTPIWYGLVVAVTVIAMGAFYYIMKKRAAVTVNKTSGAMGV